MDTCTQDEFISWTEPNPWHQPLVLVLVACVCEFQNNIKVLFSKCAFVHVAIDNYTMFCAKQRIVAYRHALCAHTFTPGVWRTVLVRFSERTGQLLVSVQAKTKDLLATDDGAAVMPGGCWGWDSVTLADLPLSRLGMIAVIATTTSREHMAHPTRNTTQRAEHHPTD